MNVTTIEELMSALETRTDGEQFAIEQERTAAVRSEIKARFRTVEDDQDADMRRMMAVAARLGR